MAEPNRVRTLIAKLHKLDTMRGVERTRLADALRSEAREVLEAEGDRGVWEATHTGNNTRKKVAALLDRSMLYVQKRASRHSTGRNGSDQG